MSNQAYPLLWPVGWKRTELYRRKRSRFGKGYTADRKPSVAYGCDQVLNELKLFGAARTTISTNIVLRNDGLPRSGQRAPEDTGVAVYFHKDGQQLVIACDTFDLVGCNLYAVSRTIAAMRQMERDGCSEILSRAFVGFKALPAEGSTAHWRTVLGVPKDCSFDTVKTAYRHLSKRWHPDMPGGDRARFEAVKAAYEEACKEYEPQEQNA